MPAAAQDSDCDAASVSHKNMDLYDSLRYLHHFSSVYAMAMQQMLGFLMLPTRLSSPVLVATGEKVS